MILNKQNKIPIRVDAMIEGNENDSASGVEKRVRAENDKNESAPKHADAGQDEIKDKG
jgi:hypothetical protein